MKSNTWGMIGRQARRGSRIPFSWMDILDVEGRRLVREGRNFYLDEQMRNSDETVNDNESILTSNTWIPYLTDLSQLGTSGLVKCF
jgi:hypothetical protein